MAGFRKVDNSSFKAKDRKLYDDWKFCDRMINDSNCSSEERIMALVTEQDIYKRRYKLHSDFLKDYWRKNGQNLEPDTDIFMLSHLIANFSYH